LIILINYCDYFGHWKKKYIITGL